MLTSTRGLPVGPGDVLVTRQSDGLTLAARAMLRPGDTVAVEGFGYRPAWEAYPGRRRDSRPVASMATASTSMR